MFKLFPQMSKCVLALALCPAFATSAPDSPPAVAAPRPLAGNQQTPLPITGASRPFESFTGKVVLVDFWATWCGPCIQALPHIKQIAHRFQGQPFVMVSVSMDKDDARWKEFVSRNGMTWPQYRDGYFDGPLARMFRVTAIPATFTIDADGVIRDQHVGDADIESNIQKLINRATSAPSPGTIAALR